MPASYSMRKGFWGGILSFFTAEFLLRCRANGAGVIVVRTIWTSSFILLTAALLEAMKDTHESVDYVQWLGVIAGAVYAAFYARFASQWAYLANLYNQIKQAEVTMSVGGRAGATEHDADFTPLDDWKIAFIDDADTLHLAGKKCFASIIVYWAQKPGTRERFAKNIPGEAERFDRIMMKSHKVLGLPPPGDGTTVT